MCYNLNYKFERGDIVSKVNAKITLQNAEDNFEYVVPAIYHEDEKVIIYNEQDDQKTLVKFNYITKELIRENDSLLMHYTFNKEKNSEGTIYVKGMEKYENNICIIFCQSRIFSGRADCQLSPGYDKSGDRRRI